MSFVSRSVDGDSLRADFDNLIENFRRIRAASGSGAPIEHTKLRAYQKQLENIDQLNNVELAGLIGIVNKYVAINELFKENCSIKVPDQKLLDLLGGQHVLTDENENYNDTFFELAMAIRFAQRSGLESEIDLTSECDVVVVSEGLAIECKYLHSEKKFRADFSDAIKQLDKRLHAAQAKTGIVAVDISNLIDKEKIWQFSQELFESFAKNYELLVDRRSAFAYEISKDGIIQSILSDRNFSGIIASYASHEAEAVFYRNFKRSEIEKLDTEKVAVIFQINHCLCFEYQGKVVPVPFRSANYYINKNLSDESYKEVEVLLHSLAVGI